MTCVIAFNTYVVRSPVLSEIKLLSRPWTLVSRGSDEQYRFIDVLCRRGYSYFVSFPGLSSYSPVLVSLVFVLSLLSRVHVSLCALKYKEC